MFVIVLDGTYLTRQELACNIFKDDSILKNDGNHGELKSKTGAMFISKESTSNNGGVPFLLKAMDSHSFK